MRCGKGAKECRDYEPLISTKKLLKSDSCPMTSSNLRPLLLNSSEYHDRRLLDHRGDSFKEQHLMETKKILPAFYKNDLIFQQTPDQDYIIQPKSMVHAGSMCVTELYSRTLRIRVISELLKNQRFEGNKDSKPVGKEERKAVMGEELLKMLGEINKKHNKRTQKLNQDLEFGSAKEKEEEGYKFKRFESRRERGLSKSMMTMRKERSLEGMKRIDSEDNGKHTGMEQLDFAKKMGKKMPTRYVKKVIKMNRVGLLRKSSR
jgi:hypothetical protein